MKRIILLLVLCATLGISSSVAQSKVPEVREMAGIRHPLHRTEIVLPQVNGYNIYKADLHVHTIFSDGHVTPAERVREAWLDGLDILAITEHLEYRPWENHFLKFTKNYNANKKPHKGVNTNVIVEPADKRGILADLNLSVELAKKAMSQYDNMLLIPGIEITRHATDIGHYCALFTKDNNKIYDPDPLKSLRKARAQGALITHNHPGYKRTTCDITEFEQKAYDAGLIDGIEVANAFSFYPPTVRRAIERNFYMVAATDTHHPTMDELRGLGVYRTMTFILAKENTAEAIREALEARRTLGYCAGNIIGTKELLGALFTASTRSKFLSKDSQGNCTYMVTNLSSIRYTLHLGGTTYHLHPFGTVTIRFIAKGGVSSEPLLRIGNMWCEDNKNITIRLQD
ncbi:MAG: PHP domain-containing protein [Rikenellaceae bacterium]|nr:PHP domain-containing protein [Rikenellaceae bacterium]